MPIDPTLQSAHFTLIRDFNAFGATLRLRALDYAHVLLIQPTNEWFLKHWDESHTNNNERHLLYLLEEAYGKGCRDTRSEIQKALGIK